MKKMLDAVVALCAVSLAVTTLWRGTTPMRIIIGAILAGSVLYVLWNYFLTVRRDRQSGSQATTRSGSRLVKKEQIDTVFLLIIVVTVVHWFWTGGVGMRIVMGTIAAALILSFLWYHFVTARRQRSSSSQTSKESGSAETPKT